MSSATAALALLVIAPPLTPARSSGAYAATITSYPVLFDARQHTVKNIPTDYTGSRLHLTGLSWNIAVDADRSRVYTTIRGPFYETSSVDLASSERMVATLRTLHGRMTTIAARHGAPLDDAEATSRFALALKAQYLVQQLNPRAREYQHTTFDAYPVNAARTALAQILRERASDAATLFGTGAMALA